MPYTCFSAVGHETDITIADFCRLESTYAFCRRRLCLDLVQTKTAMEEIRFTLRKYLMEQEFQKADVE